MRNRPIRRAAARALLPAALFLAAAALVAALTWPWILHWRGGFLAYWDPPFHAWKLEFEARRILAGDVLLRSGDTNMLYPHSGTLYYEALQYPPALFAALLFGFTAMPSELVYHVTLLVFWALSAPCMFFLLRVLGCSRAAASFGALAFCVVPWRLSYAPEFQMQLVFALPLVFAFLVRFLRDRRPADAALCALSWWLLAVSELYEAVFAAMAVPFVAAAFLGREPRMLREKRFWLGALAGGAAGLASLGVLLGPYLVQHGEGAVLRTVKEVAKHGAQPLAYLIPYGRLRLWKLPAHEAELSLYPTLAVLALGLAGAALFLRRAGAGRGRRAAAARAVAGLSLAGAAAFAAATALAAAGVSRPRFWSAAAAAAAAAGFVPLLLPERGESAARAFLRGAAAAAAVCFLLSLGPVLAAGRAGETTAPNPFFLFCRGGPLPFLTGFRVASRFGVVVLFFLLCLAPAALDRLVRGRRARRAVAALALAAVAAESFPERGPGLLFRPVEPMRASPSAARLLAEMPERTIADFPLGAERRWSDAMRKFALVGDAWPCISAWGGYFPPWAERVRRLYVEWNLPELHRELAKPYPDVLLLLDAAPAVEKPAFRDPARSAFRPGWWREEPDKPALPRHFESIATLRDGDGRFFWMDLKPVGPQAVCERIFRASLLRGRPVCEAAVRAAPGAAVSAAFNGVPAAAATAGGDGVARFRFRPLEAARPRRAAPDSIAFSAAGGGLCELLSFALVPDAPAAPGRARVVDSGGGIW